MGYFDTDLSTPVSEIRRLLDTIEQSDAAVVMGSRISPLGSDTQRSAVRHYLGRIFATAASLVLQTRIYDTQCEAKLFRRSPALEAALADPFLSRWSFDVERLGRLLVGTASARHRREEVHRGPPPLPARRSWIRAPPSGYGQRGDRTGADRHGPDPATAKPRRG